MPSDTKQAIAAAFAQLSQKKPVDKITVKDFVEHCGISRQTFYYHFADIAELMHCAIAQDVLARHSIADAMLGEITPRMAQAVAQADAKRILIPINHCDNIVVGVSDLNIRHLLEEVLAELEKIAAGGC